MRVNYKLVWISSIYMYTTLQEDRLVCGPASVWNCVQWTLVLTCTVESNPHTPAMQEEAAPCRPRLWQVLNHTKCLFTFQPERTLLNWTHFMKIKVLMVAKSYALIWWKSVWALRDSHDLRRFARFHNNPSYYIPTCTCTGTHTYMYFQCVSRSKKKADYNLKAMHFQLMSTKG